jgi:hypothetical protein
MEPAEGIRTAAIPERSELRTSSRREKIRKGESQEQTDPPVPLLSTLFQKSLSTFVRGYLPLPPLNIRPPTPYCAHVQ